MSTFLEDKCYESSNTYAACIEFHQDKHHRRGFNASQLIDYILEPNSNAGDDRGGSAQAPPQKLSLAFSTADVVILGWRLGPIADYLRDNKLSAVGILPKRYAELERNAIYVSSIVVTPITKNNG